MVRTRIPPSPTGEDLHIGNLQTALINWVWAHKNKGRFVVRIEDTDQLREVKGARKRILQTFKDYGLFYDEGPDAGGEYGPYIQSERLEIYKKYAEELIRKKAAYYCFCSRERLDELRKKQQAEGKVPRYDKYCLHNETHGSDKPHVVRLNVPPDREIAFKDVVRGDIKFNTNDIDDQVLLKSDGFPTYHLAVVIDDYLMKITHVIRGEDWISSTPKHVLLYEAFGWPLPIFAHTPLLRNPDKSKLSKRRNPVWARWYLDQGFLPEAILNYLVLMGWSHPKQKEIFDIDELIRVFELKDMQAVGPVFDIVKLEWMNGEYIRKTQNAKLKIQIFEFYNKKYPENIIDQTIPLIKERIKKLSDYLPLCEFFFERPINYEIDLAGKVKLLTKTHEVFSQLKDWEAGNLGDAMQKVAKDLGIKNSEYFMTIRVAITGKKISPPLNESMEILGRDECVARLKSVL